jgi:hypothetical protein
LRAQAEQPVAVRNTARGQLVRDEQRGGQIAAQPTNTKPSTDDRPRARRQLPVCPRPNVAPATLRATNPSDVALGGHGLFSVAPARVSFSILSARWLLQSQRQFSVVAIPVGMCLFFVVLELT